MSMQMGLTYRLANGRGAKVRFFLSSGMPLSCCDSAYESMPFLTFKVCTKKDCEYELDVPLMGLLNAQMQEELKDSEPMVPDPAMASRAAEIIRRYADWLERNFVRERRPAWDSD